MKIGYEHKMLIMTNYSNIWRGKGIF